MRIHGAAVLMLALLVTATGQVQAAVITTYYGDDDGFGVGETSGTLTAVTTSHAGPGEAAYTDVRLIGTGYAAPPFEPTGAFSPFTIPAGEDISWAALTMRTGAWDSGPSPVEGVPNTIVLDGLAVPASFIDQFSTDDTSVIETESIVLDPSFFPSLADGSVSLVGTILSEDGGSGSFQVDFLRLDIETTPTVIPEPATLSLLGLGLLALRPLGRARDRQAQGRRSRRRRRR